MKARGGLCHGDKTLHFQLNAGSDPHFALPSKSVGFQDGKATFLKWMQNIYGHSVNFCSTINYMSVQERTITCYFVVIDWQFALF